MANEPVYNPQATAYLLRDDPKAVIRAFYSYLACALQPVGPRARRAPLDLGAVLRTAQHRRRLVRALPQHADSRARRRTACFSSRRLPGGGSRTASESRSSAPPASYGKLSMTHGKPGGLGPAPGRGRAVRRVSDLKTLLVRFRHPQSKPHPVRHRERAELEAVRSAQGMGSHRRTARAGTMRSTVTLLSRGDSATTHVRLARSAARGSRSRGTRGPGGPARRPRRRSSGRGSERGEDVLAAERDRPAGEGDEAEQLVVVDLAEARAAVLVARGVAVVLDAEAAHLVGARSQVGNRVDVRGSPSRCRRRS